jgi:hypothetical protein
MPIYLRFENAVQVEATTLAKKPEGTGWYKAPTDFDFEKHYKLLDDGTIAERDESDVVAELLGNSKVGALDTVRFILNTYRRKYAGYSHEKSRSYDIQAKAAESILSAVANNQTPNEADTVLIQPLADLRSISVIDMAKLIQSKAEKSVKAIAKCEALEDQAQNAIKRAPTQEELSLFLNGFEENLNNALKQL